ncbi:hypothetical protein [uncultured Fibrella sp.]|uniref:hypothetical protein n=1 Tax=uncultured Fibrella sp. TaxID=1284596 RepID=UPI0035CC50A7
MQPKVFVSYSEKGQSELIKKFIGEIKGVIIDNDCVPVDPMTDRDIGSIKEKVEEDIRRSDILFVEGTLQIPNVMYEIGYAEASGKPYLLFVNDNILTDEKLREHREFLGIQKRRMASDLGDKEYFKYPSKIDDSEGWSKFKNEVGEMLTKLKKHELSSKKIQLVRSQQELRLEVAEIGKLHNHSHPIIGLLAGWFDRIVKDLKDGGRDSFEIDSDYYQSCLSYFSREGDKIVAVADLDFEPFWLDNPDPLNTRVSERIFLLKWSDLHDDYLLDKQYKILASQAKEYNLYVSSAPEISLIQRFLPDTISWNFLLIEPDLVGYYVLQNGRKLLKIRKDRNIFEDMKSVYSELKQDALRIERGRDYLSLKKAYIEKKQIGAWKEEYSQEVQDRPSEYFDLYKEHIMCWIPQYNGLIEHCSNVTQVEILKILRESDTKLKVLEIGYGDGALTGKLLNWIDTINQPMHIMQDNIIQYMGVDPAQRRWINSLRENLGFELYDRYHNSFLEGAAWDALDPITIANKPYNVICGSLVLHDILEHDNSRIKINEMLSSRMYGHLAQSGSVIFADVFFDGDKKRQDYEDWKKWMRKNLPNNEVENFFERNPEMINFLSTEEFSSIAKSHNYEIEVIKIPRRLRWNPFKVIILRDKR